MRAGGTAEDLRHLAMSAPHARTRERALAPSTSTTSRRALAPRAWPRAPDAIPRPSWVGCTLITHRVLTLSGFAAPAADPLCAQIAAALRDAVCAAQRTAATPPGE